MPKLTPARHLGLSGLAGILLSGLLHAQTPADHPELKSRAIPYGPFDQTFLVNPYDRADMLQLYWSVFAPGPMPALNWTGSYTVNGGTISPAVRAREYALANAARAMIGSPPTKEVAATIPYVQAAALLQAQNWYIYGLSHTPAANWNGWTDMGYAGSNRSELAAALVYGSNNITEASAVLGFLDDPGANNAIDLGHRVTLLSRINQYHTVGLAPDPRFSGVNSITCAYCACSDALPGGGEARIPQDMSDPTDLNNYVLSWPTPGFFPSSLLKSSTRWSVSFDAYYAQMGATPSVTVSLNGRRLTLSNVTVNNARSVYAWSISAQDFDPATLTDDAVFDVTIDGMTRFPTTTRYPAVTYRVTVFPTAKVSSTPRPIAKTALGNISTRAIAGQGDNVLIAGFIVGGSTPVRVLVRAQGPGLKQYGIQNAMSDPTIELVQNSTSIGGNDDWQQDPSWRLIQSYDLQPGDAKDAGFVATLWPGSYSVIVRDKGAGGVGIVEAFNIDGLTATPIQNLSTRGVVDSGEGQMIAGFILNQKQTVLLRAQGPSLRAYGVANAIDDPTMTLYDAAGKVLAVNDDYTSSASTSAFLTSGAGAGFRPGSSKEPVIIATLEPGSYSAIVSNRVPKSGVGLVELFSLGN